MFFSSFIERLIKQGKQCKTKPSKIPTFWPDALALFRILDTTHVYIYIVYILKRARASGQNAGILLGFVLHCFHVL